jgi:hypothetical protein
MATHQFKTYDEISLSKWEGEKCLWRYSLRMKYFSVYGTPHVGVYLNGEFVEFLEMPENITLRRMWEDVKTKFRPELFKEHLPKNLQRAKK